MERKGSNAEYHPNIAGMAINEPLLTCNGDKVDVGALEDSVDLDEVLVLPNFVALEELVRGDE